MAAAAKTFGLFASLRKPIWDSRQNWHGRPAGIAPNQARAGGWWTWAGKASASQTLMSGRYIPRVSEGSDVVVAQELADSLVGQVDTARFPAQDDRRLPGPDQDHRLGGDRGHEHPCPLR